MIAIGASSGTEFTFIDASDAFQNNIFLDLKRRVYVTLRIKYLEWFRGSFHNHPLVNSKNSNKLVMQSLSNI